MSKMESNPISSWGIFLKENKERFQKQWKDFVKRNPNTQIATAE